jgi:hypothetical protein
LNGSSPSRQRVSGRADEIPDMTGHKRAIEDIDASVATFALLISNIWVTPPHEHNFERLNFG